jgi:hypothetical protein
MVRHFTNVKYCYLVSGDNEANFTQPRLLTCHSSKIHGSVSEVIFYVLQWMGELKGKKQCLTFKCE